MTCRHQREEVGLDIGDMREDKTCKEVRTWGHELQGRCIDVDMNFEDVTLTWT